MANHIIPRGAEKHWKKIDWSRPDPKARQEKRGK
jgi:hypothetical protein